MIDAGALARDAAALVQVPSVTGDERAALERLGELATDLGLEARLVRHDLAALRAHADHPGEEAPREDLFGLVVTARDARGSDPSATSRSGRGRRVALCGHVDVVGPGTVAWSHGGPWSGVVDGGWLHGRGSVDMKGGVVAALHAVAAHARAGGEGCEAVLVAVASEEDGGLGAFAALQDDADFDLCVIPEPTGLDVVCAQAGALTFTGEVPGVAAHAAQRLEGVSAIDRYLPVHEALAALEADLNRDVEHPLMRGLALPYPVLVGRLTAGEWSSSVPDRLEFEGRAPVRVGETPALARAAVEQAVRAACADAELAWTGGQFASAATDPDGPAARRVRTAAAAVLGREPAVAGVPWGADMRLWCAAGVPTVMFGPRGIDLAHAVDERVRIDDLVTTAEVLTRVLA